MKKRLFLFASYDKFQRVDPTLTYYLKCLSQLGDIVFVMDTDLPASELSKITEIPNVLHAVASRHGEYDFGSYKRGYIWARDNKLLSKYDWVYLVNDSVFGPFGNLGAMLDKMESSGADLTGMNASNLETQPGISKHLQSWFIGLSKEIATSNFFNDFICTVQPETEKMVLVMKYEVRLSHLILSHGYKMFALFELGMDIHTKPCELLTHGVPFLKKNSEFLSVSTWVLYQYAPVDAIDAIINYVKQYGLFSSKPLINAEYEKIKRFTIFGLPIFSIFRKKSQYYAQISYKVKILDFLPICKYTRKK